LSTKPSARASGEGHLGGPLRLRYKCRAISESAGYVASKKEARRRNRVELYKANPSYWWDVEAAEPT